MDSKYFALGVLLVAFFAAAGLGVLVYLDDLKPAQPQLGQKGAVGQQKAILPSQLPQGQSGSGAQKQSGSLPQKNASAPAQQLPPGSEQKRANVSVIPVLNASIPSNRLASMQLGLNFIRFYWEEGMGAGLDKETPYVQPSAIFSDFSSLGAQGYRQFVKADLLWDNVEPVRGQWNFEAPDAVVANPDYEPIATLFSMQYASATPPWAKTPAEFQKTVGPEAREYLETVVKRYAPYVKYWEIGNEMDHWRAATEGGGSASSAEKLPAARPSDGFSPVEQGVFLAQAAEIIRENDPDAQIVMPGMSSPDDYCVNTWLAGVVEGGGSGWFDIVNYHYYSSWERYPLMRPLLSSAMKNLSIGHKPVWLTETGATSDAALVARTNYPNSEQEQSADVFRRIVPAYGQGDAYVGWHTYIGNDDAGSDWRGYGMKIENGTAKPAYYSFGLLAQELLPFSRVETLASDARSTNAYKVTTTSGDVKYVVWGKGIYSVPSGVLQMAAVVPDASGNFSWQATSAGAKLALNGTPVLLK